MPSALNQFRLTLDKQTKNELFKLMEKYTPETKKQAAERRLSEAKAKKEEKKANLAKKAPCLKYGIQQVTRMIEEKQAKMVVIAHDVDPIEIVVWLPSLCKAQNIPYCIVKGKAALGKFVGMKTCTCVCFTSVKGEHSSTFSKLQDAVTSGFNGQYDEMRKSWGGMMMGRKGRPTKAA